MAGEVERWLETLAVKVHSAEVPVETLSGGNQQRVVLAKWMATNPSVLILDGPTVGIDVAAKSSIHQIILRLASEGVGIILISDEVNEVCATCSRVLVMRAGRLVGEFAGIQVDKVAISEAVVAPGPANP
jgi:simple sugar transport system ATP-binding protein